MITSFRMYNAVPRAAAAWRRLFEHVFADTGADIEIIEHKWPEPIAELWSRPDLCCGFMCGWPLTHAPAMKAIAAPVPSPPRYQGLPRYCSEFLVREDTGWRSLEQTFGHRFGWMASNSQSGFNAPRAHLARLASPARPRLFAESVGPLGSPMKALEALRAGEVDVIALDSYFLDLVRHYEPQRMRAIRCIDTTPWTPIPLLVASPGMDAGVVERLRSQLLSLDRQPAYAALLEDVLLLRFVAADVERYIELDAMARFAIERGYEAIR